MGKRKRHEAEKKPSPSVKQQQPMTQPHKELSPLVKPLEKASVATTRQESTVKRKAPEKDNQSQSHISQPLKKRKLTGIDKERLKQALSKSRNTPATAQSAATSLSPASNTKTKPTTTPSSQLNASSLKRPTSAAKSTNASSAPSSLSTLQQQMQKKLAGAKFRWINEILYTKESNEAVQIFGEKPEMFDIYHTGFRSQVESWPTNPIDIFITYLRTKSSHTVVADMGCGEGKIAQTLHNQMTIHSFDLASPNEFVITCDISKVPLKPSTVDVVIFCLSLMGTNFMDFIREAHRIMKPKGELKIAEVVSRFPDIDRFVDALKEVGFTLVRKDDSNKMFILFDFVKDGAGTQKVVKKGGQSAKNKGGSGEGKKGKGGKEGKAGKTGNTGGDAAPLLKPCVYKKR
ncbi:25S rRNA (adenine645-N1)-methyltransferase [Borealophlyctis nickersoniae]|nr:25S rRNA (adenine645-N1)-methyltransferase [Borealophlyctis nickersoniae]